MIVCPCSMKTVAGKSHIGAVGIVDPAGNITVKQFEGHKEGILCQQWCETLFKAVN